MTVREHSFEAVTFEYEKWLARPFQAADLEKFDDIANQIFQLLSDEKTTHFIPEKKLLSLEAAHLWLQQTVLNFHTGRSYTHFITEKKTGKLAGIIDVLSPELTQQHYRLTDYPYFIEFYLMRNAQNRLLMSNLLPEVIANLRNQGIQSIAAVVNRKNSASMRVLEKSGFRYHTKFDMQQDLFIVL
jgi:ribosomal-protein-alanine N-acetyltransferase